MENFMPKIKSGLIIKYIMGESSQSFKNLEKIVTETDNIEDAKDNCLLITESIENYKIMINSINTNKWKEGIQGGAIAGTLIVGISSAISPITSLTAATFRMFSGVVTGGTSALIYSKMSEQCCNRAATRLEQVERLLETAKEKALSFECNIIPRKP
jgi:hypothetical protein